MRKKVVPIRDTSRESRILDFAWQNRDYTKTSFCGDIYNTKKA